MGCVRTADSPGLKSDDYRPIGGGVASLQRCTYSDISVLSTLASAREVRFWPGMAKVSPFFTAAVTNYLKFRSQVLGDARDINDRSHAPMNHSKHARRAPLA